MNRLWLIVFLGSVLFAACGCSQITGTAAAPTDGSGQVGGEQAPAQTLNPVQPAQSASPPQTVPGTDQKGTNPPPDNQPGTNANVNTKEDSDLARIPGDPQPAAAADGKAASSGSANGRIYLENAFTQTGQRGGLIVPAPLLTVPTPWQERLFLDVRKVWQLDERLNFSFSDRLNLRAQNDIALPNHENVINDFREGFLSWQPHDGFYLDLGRINLRSGAALGFNPTDFFKSRAVVEPLSADPSVLREDRLGTLMLETQYIGQGRALTVAVAPALVRASPLYTDTNLLSFNPSIDRTNSHDRILAKGSFSIGKDFNPELLYYREGSQNKFGANLTRGLGQKVIAYAEWAGGESTNLIDESLRYGRETGTFPENARSPLPGDANVHLQNDLSAGASYTTANKITFNLEYHLHQAGFSREDWSNWFNAGQGQPGTSPIAGELWYIRAYALDQQVPLARQSAFLRADWVDALIPNLEITGFINPDLYDGSSLIQVSADYYISRSWTIGAQVNANAGSRRSDFGSLPQSVGALFRLARYL
jgi:hypothetical protein